MNKYLFTNEFEALCVDSSGEAVMQVEESPAYEKVKKNENERINHLSRKLDNQELLGELHELIDCITDFPVMKQMAVYKQAYRDCINLLNWLGLLNLEKKST